MVDEKKKNFVVYARPYTALANAADRSVYGCLAGRRQAASEAATEKVHRARKNVWSAERPPLFGMTKTIPNMACARHSII